MNKCWVLNASPIISLGKAELLRTMSPLAKTWLVPEGVIHEIEIKSPIESYLSDLSYGSKVVRERVPQIDPSIVAWNLGQGESEVLALALGEVGRGVVLDDLQARRCAILFDIPLIGSLGLIVLARRKGLLHVAKPAIDKLLAAGFYINPEMVARILVAIGEGKR